MVLNVSTQSLLPMDILTVVDIGTVAAMYEFRRQARNGRSLQGGRIGPNSASLDGKLIPDPSLFLNHNVPCLGSPPPCIL